MNKNFSVTRQEIESTSNKLWFIPLFISIFLGFWLFKLTTDIREYQGNCKFLFSIMEESSERIFIVDIRGKIIWLNNSSAKLLEGVIGDFQGKKIDEYIPQKYWGKHNKGLQEWFKNHEHHQKINFIICSMLTLHKNLVPVTISLEALHLGGEEIFVGRILEQKELEGIKNDLFREIDSVE